MHLSDPKNNSISRVGAVYCDESVNENENAREL